MDPRLILSLLIAADQAGDVEDAIFVAPNIGVSQRLSDVTKSPHKPTLPPELAVPGAVYWGLYKICVDRAGKVGSIGVLRGASRADPEAGLPEVGPVRSRGKVDIWWIQIVRGWSYRPYEVNGRVVPFCHPLRIEVRVAAEPEASAEPAKPVMLSREQAERLLVTDVSKPPHQFRMPPRLDRSGNIIWGLFKVCVTTFGEVSRISVIKPAEADANRLWIETMHGWRYTPHNVAGKATPFCYPRRVEVRAF